MKEMTITQAQLTIHTLRVGTKQVTKAMWNQIPRISFGNIDLDKAKCLGYVSIGNEKEYLVNIDCEPFITTNPRFGYMIDNWWEVSASEILNSCGKKCAESVDRLKRFDRVIGIDVKVNYRHMKGLSVNCILISRKIDEVMNFINYYEPSIKAEDVLSHFEKNKLYPDYRHYFVIGQSDSAIQKYKDQRKRLSDDMHRSSFEMEDKWSDFTRNINQLYIAV